MRGNKRVKLGFNPLSVGAFLRTEADFGELSTTLSFQSPFSRGIPSDSILAWVFFLPFRTKYLIFCVTALPLLTIFVSASPKIAPQNLEYREPHIYTRFAVHLLPVWLGFRLLLIVIYNYNTI